MSRARLSGGFTLVELLVVMGILVILMVALLPKLGSIGSSQSITQAYGAIPDMLRQARAYAMANNTYVYVGILEADGSKSNTGTQTKGTGRIYIGIASSKDGTNGTPAGTLDATNLTPLAKLQSFEGIGLVSQGKVGNVFPADESVSSGIVDVDSSSAATGFSWSDVGSKAIGTQKFDQVLQFAPDGSANIIGSTGVASYLRMEFVPFHGNKMDPNLKNVFGVQVDGITGAVRAFRLGES